ncbi:DNA-packaging protein [Pelagerythrobacter rhizovicinus]|uniref:ATP-binding protein n=1 Tax=Pelagerythrobacter rhizovicinus TaxID=2268576 RepID=A0A4Q2KL05_9SPHN|nr:terminase family protein [Pelagerythrobacter rhizovicinus]RXZ64890.1 ATP-binding protein [Pelagerythrobacter rhizovicinus]
MEDEPLDPKFAELLDLPEKERQKELARLTDDERKELRHHWNLWARRDQLPPARNWSAWLICAGRGFGKTRAGAEWVREVAKRDPEARIALVGASLAEARAVMVEGESGVLACSPPHRCPAFEPSLRRLSWANGAQATLYSAAEPESLRGPQHSHAWCDEIAKWDMAGERATRAWDNLLLGLRLGDLPRVLATTTPRPVPLMLRLLEEEAKGEIAVTRGTTHANRPNLPERFVEDIDRRFAGTSFARQELGGELLTEIDGALWSRALLERCRDEGAHEEPARVVVGVDPPAGAQGDACGIVVAGLLPCGEALVLADCSVERPSPERWARAVAEAAHAWRADRVVAEANQGGAMVASVLRAADLSLPLRLVHASRSKVARAEPVAALYESGRVHHAGLFAQLEDQMCGLMAGGRYEGPGRSPDRTDALVWALTELMLGQRARPRISVI